MHGIGEAHAKHQEKRDNRPLPRHLGGSCELREGLMRCFDGPKQQRRDRHTSRAQRPRGRCAIVHLKPRVVCTWRFTQNFTGFVTSRSEPRPNLPQHGSPKGLAFCFLNYYLPLDCCAVHTSITRPAGKSTAGWSVCAHIVAMPCEPAGRNIRGPHLSR